MKVAGGETGWLGFSGGLPCVRAGLVGFLWLGAVFVPTCFVGFGFLLELLLWLRARKKRGKVGDTKGTE